jgi:hypothetical protein
MYPDNNSIENAWIEGNQLTGYGGDGIVLAGGCCGAEGNRISNVFVLENLLSGIIPVAGFEQSSIRRARP